MMSMMGDSASYEKETAVENEGNEAQVRFDADREGFRRFLGAVATHYIAIPAHAPFELRWASQGEADREHPVTDLDCVVKEQGPCRIVVFCD